VGERIDEYGDWEVACGGQKKVLKASLKWKTKSIKDEEVWGCCYETWGQS
jgi:hypothetical protein